MTFLSSSRHFTSGFPSLDPVVSTKHAYLIMAHNQFLSLQELVSVLDDARNDIYLHFDKKVKVLPAIRTCYSKLVVVKERINVIWGDVSQIKAEYALFKASFQKETYSYYHLISGVHFPLMSNDDLHRWFAACNDACVLRRVSVPEGEIPMRFGMYHFFLKHLVSKNRFINKAYHLGWRSALRIQKGLGIQRDTSFIRGKASQWCSLSENAVRLLLSSEKKALKLFRRSFCCDEYFVRAFIEDNAIPIVYDNRICYVEFVNTTPKQFSEDDFETLMSSGALFFRKMSDTHLGLASKIEQIIRL